MVIDTARIASLADQCVKCGLCQPVCPTYRVARTEAESPRGRIAFAQSLTNRELAPSASLVRHLDQCLACMSCERVCPSQVRYAELIVATRALLRERAPARFNRASMDWLIRYPRWLRAALVVLDLPLLRRFVDSRIGQGLLRAVGLDRAVRERPHLPRGIPGSTTAASTRSRGRVGLFLGCVASVVDRDVHAAARILLHALGYDVVVPPGQQCCGALALHDGDVDGAAKMAAPTRTAFEHAGLDTVLVSASGCFGTLRENVFKATSIEPRDIHQFLARDERLFALKFRPLAATVALHTPCTQANVVRSGDTIRDLLSRIPQLRIVVLPGEPGCCGAAGDYFLRHAGIADSLRDETLDSVQAVAPEMLVTSNVGCRIFLDNGLRQRKTGIPVIHPIALLARQLDN